MSTNNKICKCCNQKEVNYNRSNYCSDCLIKNCQICKRNLPETNKKNCSECLAKRRKTAAKHRGKIKAVEGSNPDLKEKRLEKCREYIKDKRTDPTYIANEKIYRLRHNLVKGITIDPIKKQVTVIHKKVMEELLKRSWANPI